MSHFLHTYFERKGLQGGTGRSLVECVYCPCLGFIAAVRSHLLSGGLSHFCRGMCQLWKGMSSLLPPWRLSSLYETPSGCVPSSHSTGLCFTETDFPLSFFNNQKITTPCYILFCFLLDDLLPDAVFTFYVNCLGHNLKLSVPIFNEIFIRFHQCHTYHIQSKHKTPLLHKVLGS